MHAYLIVGKDKDKIEKEINHISTNSVPLRFSLQKIDKTHELTSFLRLSQPSGTYILIEDVDLATTEALNAFLKNLEEPQDGLTYILTATNEYKVIGTILSRCQIVRIAEKTNYQNENMDLIKDFFNAKTNKKLLLIDKYKKRDEALLFLQNLLRYLHVQIISSEDNSFKTARATQLVQFALNNLIANGNTTLQLTNLIVKLDSLS